MKRVLVAGATGYLGGFVVQELKTRGYFVRALARSAKKVAHLASPPDDVVEAEVTRPETLEHVCDGIDMVFSSIGITKQKDGLTFRDVDYGRFDSRGAAVRLWAHWIPAKIKIQSVDFDSRIITLDQPYAGDLQGTVWNDAWAARTATRFYIYNSRSFLDQPGEFYMDPDSHRLYYRPRRTPIEEQTILAPTANWMIDMDGASDINSRA